LLEIETGLCLLCCKPLQLSLRIAVPAKIVLDEMEAALLRGCNALHSSSSKWMA
jgi:hypothetical protein